MQKKDGKKLMIAGTVAGALAGYLAGLLTAPKSGKETRKDIKDNAIKARLEAENKLKTLYKELTKLQNDLSVKLKKVSGRTKRDINSLYKKTEKSRSKIKELLSAIRDGEAEEKDIKSVIKDADDILSKNQKKKNDNKS